MSEIIEQKGVVVRSEIEGKSTDEKIREALRYDFLYSCAYCSLTEMEAWAIRFEKEHYLPQKKHPELKNEYKNLMWSCERCNSYKNDFSPSKEDIEKKHQVIKIDEENPSNHFEEKEYRLQSKTEKGNFNIALLYLNRKHLRRIREIRGKYHVADEKIKELLKKLASIKIDSVKPRARYQFLQIKNKLLLKNNFLSESLRELAFKYLRSPLIDEDPDKKSDLKARRRYLDSIKALHYEKVM